MMTLTQYLKFLILSGALKKNCTVSSNLFKEYKPKSSGVLKMSCETMNFSLFSDLFCKYSNHIINDNY